MITKLWGQSEDVTLFIEFTLCLVLRMAAKRTNYLTRKPFVNRAAEKVPSEHRTKYVAGLSLPYRQHRLPVSPRDEHEGVVGHIQHRLERHHHGVAAFAECIAARRRALPL
jgi:hypothetical protein